MPSTATSTTTAAPRHPHYLEPRSGPLRRRVQGQAHDDLQRKRQVHGLSGVLNLDEADLHHSSVEASSPLPLSTPATLSATATSRAPTSSTPKSSRPDLQVHQHRVQGRRRLRRHRRPDHPRRHQTVTFAVEGPARRPKIHGATPDRPLRHHQNQSQGLRLELELGARNRRRAGRRRSDHHPRHAIRQGC